MTAWQVGPLGDAALPIDLASGLNLFRNVSTGANFLMASISNSITFTAPTTGGIIRTGQYINSGVFVANPGGGSDNVRFDVTYELDFGVPEPGTYVTTGLALTGLGLWRKRVGKD